ncbi:rho GTPase-activating protein 11A-like [Contarinia nasturtii]|uniref:rho GTPase-activating protein 11A-like n=1 Tax=Contarinia nasturtii TaxID=265458 RepID=UPI0012D4A33E|nr:rho GTPase-activating protein 11A-like [Contarinia nasturtii]
MFINEVPNNAELSAIIVSELRDMYGIKFRKEKKLKSQQHSSHHKIFGVPLNNLEFTDVKLSNGSLCRIPMFLSDACSRIMDQIELEGIFRKAGSTIRQKEIREKIELGIWDDSYNVIDIASILKYFFRELPDPLLPPGNFQETILRCLIGKNTNERKISAIKMVCLLLPNVVLNTLVYFMQFLNLVSLHSTSNKMSTKNLAIIFAPGLMPINESYGQRLVSHVQIIEILIDNAHELGLVPSHLQHRLPSLDLPTDPLNFTMFSSGSETRRSIDRVKVPETDIKKKKKRRSGSLTRMFNGFRKIVGATIIGTSTENLDDSHENEVQSTPCINKSKKRRTLETGAFSSKKKKDVLALLQPTGLAGGILPSTPMACSKNKPTKKSRLSLGGKRYTKNASQHSNGPKSSIVSSLERRWSFMVSGNGNGPRENQKTSLNTIQDTSTSVAQPEPNDKCEQAWEAQITKSEYEEIKDRVKAIESRISKEFTKLQSSLANNSIDSVDTNDTRNGPERVLEKFERTLEETELMNTSPMMTEQLANHLSRGLKIRSSTENRIIRSPSARKIGNIRRKSQENVRLTRNKSWHLGPNSSPRISRGARIIRKSPLQQVTLQSPNVEKHVQIPRANLKRGRPNTFANGLRCTQQATENIKSAEKKSNTFVVSDNTTDNNRTIDLSNDLKNEQWMCAENFFDGMQTPGMTEENPINTSRSSTKTSTTKVKPCRKRLNMNFDITPTNQQNNSNTPRSANKNNISVIDTMKTPMLPPRLPLVKKTPAKTPHSVLANRNVFTPLWQQEQQQIAGRASIARLRSQNAGMVMAKAKLFDGLVTEQPNVKKNPRIIKTDTQNNNQSDQENKPYLDPSIRSRLNQSRSANNSPRRNKATMSGVHRRQQLRAHRHTPIKKTPINLDKNLLTITGNNHRSPAIQSPLTRRIGIDATPHAKGATMIAKPPRRIITPQNKRKPL